MLAAFNKNGFEITVEDLHCGNPKTVITRAHFARALLKRGYVSSVDQAFRKYLNPDIEIGSGRGGLRVSALYLDDIKLSMFMAGIGRS